MKRTTNLVVGTLLVTIAANLPANAGHLQEWLTAFKRHNYTAAAALLRMPAYNGDPGAQAILCFMYTNGRGVPQNYREAANWCRRAAEQGSSEAQYMLGLMYNKGQGVPEDFVKAYKWLNLAATRASGPKRDFSYRMRDSVATKMSPAQVAKAQMLAVEWIPVLEFKSLATIKENCTDAEKCPRLKAIVPRNLVPTD